MSKLVVRKLSARYGPARILFDLNLHVDDGEVVALLGRNGSGKSTTLRAILGLGGAPTGHVVFRGVDISRTPTHAIARLGLGYVPEDRRVFSRLTVADNLRVGMQHMRRDAPAWTVERIYDLFPNLAGMPDRPAGQISGGEQQMLTIARTLMGNPSMIMLDEPSEGLAPKIVTQMAETIGRLKTEGLSILLSEQNLRFAKSISDRAYVIESGHMRFEGTIAELASNPTISQSYLAI